MIESKLGYGLIDSDNHYYEAEDAFLRNGDEDVKRFVRWIQEGKKRKLAFGERISDTPGNPTFHSLANAGAFHQRLKDPLGDDSDSHHVPRPRALAAVR